MATAQSGTNNGYYAVMTVTQASQSVAGNYSTVNWNVTIYSGAINFSGYTIGYDVYVNGSQVAYHNNSGNQTSLGKYTSKVVASGTTTIYHNSNGEKKQVPFSFRVFTDSTSYTPGSLSASGTIDLTTIARASTPSCITYPNNTQNVGNVGTKITIHMNRADNSFTHTVTYSFGSKSGTIGTGVGDNVEWTIPKDLANAIPNNASGSGTITCVTYSGSTNVGSKSIPFTVTVPETDEFKPTISSIALSEAVSGLASKFGCYVQGKSKISGTVTASGAYSSTIKSYKVTINGSTYNAKTFTTGVLSGTGSKPCSVTVTDSRGRTFTKSANYTVVAYSSPYITTFSVVRCNSSGTADENGGYARVVVKGGVSSVNSKNSYSYKLEYKKTTASSYTNYSISNSAYTIDKTYTNIAVDTDSSYEFRLTISDYFTSAPKTVPLGSVFQLVNYNASGKGLAFGKVSEGNAFECNLPSTFYQGNRFKAGNTYEGSNTYNATNYFNAEQFFNSYISWYDKGVSDCNAITRSGTYNTGPSTANTPIAYCRILAMENSGTDATQLAISVTNGKTWVRGRANGTWRDWHLVSVSKVLYSNTSGSNGTITLTESAANFSYLEIYYGDVNGPTRDFLKVHSPNGAIVNTSVLSQGDSGGVIRVNTRRLTISGNTITPSKYQVNYVPNSSQYTVNEQYIYKVNGYL